MICHTSIFYLNYHFNLLYYVHPISYYMLEIKLSYLILSLRFHKIGFHVYTEGTEIYVSYKCDDPLQALGKINFKDKL